MTAMALTIGAFLLSWLLLTASLILQHIADRDGFAAIIWAMVPTIGILALSYIQTISPAVTQDVLSFAVAGGLFVLTGVSFSKSFRRFRASRS